jgi:hypothetical protein
MEWLELDWAVFPVAVAIIAVLLSQGLKHSSKFVIFQDWEFS